MPEGKKYTLPEVAKLGNLELLRKLLEYGLDIASTDEHGNTALHYACYHGFNAIVLDLLKRKISPVTLLEIINKDGNTSLHLACQTGRLVIVQTILTSMSQFLSEQQQHPQTQQEQKGESVEISSMMLSFINLKNLKGQTALHICCAGGHLSLVGPLIKAGGLTSLRTYQNETIFDLCPKIKLRNYGM